MLLHYGGFAGGDFTHASDSSTGRLAMRGDLNPLREKAPGGRFTLLHPLGDGTRMLVAAANRSACAAGVFTIAGDKIVREADAPRPLAPPDAILRPRPGVDDGRGNLWIPKDQTRPGGGWLAAASEAWDAEGRSVASRRGYPILEDRGKNLWFVSSQMNQGVIIRRDGQGNEASLTVPGLLCPVLFAELLRL